MSPLVKRTVTTVNEQTKSRRQRDHITYIPPNRLVNGDVIVRPTPRQLIELEDAYPDEYEEGGLGHQYGIWTEGGSAAASFTEMPWQEACDLVRDAGERGLEEKLQEYFDSEKERRPFRKSVMKELVRHGVEDAREYV